MADHWATPEARGIYQNPISAPPTPQHHTSNDHGARLARIEEHVQFTSHNVRRVETDSMRRAHDIVSWITSQLQSVNSRVAETDQRVRDMELYLIEVKARKQAIWQIVSGSGSFVTTITGFLKWSSVAAVAYLLVKGHITVDAAKLLLGALGWPTGS